MKVMKRRARSQRNRRLPSPRKERSIQFFFRTNEEQCPLAVWWEGDIFEEHIHLTKTFLKFRIYL
jgi:hypothetical protein